MTNWLAIEDVRVVINLPTSFDNVDFLDTYVTSAVEDWLTDLIGEKRVGDLANWLKTDYLGGEDWLTDLIYPAPLYRLTLPFLIYAAWSDYVLFGSITASNTGLVSIVPDKAEAVSDPHRAELNTYFRNKAVGKAKKITEHVAALDQGQTDCGPGGLYTVPISSARGRTKSLF